MARKSWILFALVWALSTAGLLAQPPGVTGFGGLDTKIRVSTAFADAPARAGERITLEVEVSVEDGWHLYGATEKTGIPTSLTFDAVEGLKPVGKTRMPVGKAHTQFGKTSFWLEDEFVLRQDFEVAADVVAGELKLTGQMDYMACTETFCDPPANEPIEVTLTIEGGAARSERLPESAATSAPVAGNAAAGAGSGGFQDPMPFAIPGMSRATAKARFVDGPARAGETATLEVEVEVEDGWHIYGSKETFSTPTSLEFIDGELTPHGPAEVPPGEEHVQFETKSYWLSGKFTIRQTFVVPESAEPGDLSVQGEMVYIPCDDKFCEDETSEMLSATLTVEAGEARAERLPQAIEPVARSGDPEPTAGSEYEDLDASGNDLGTRSLWLFLMAAVGWGLFALAMPCTYPMIPITISFFTKQASARGGSVLPLALTYGIGIVGMFVLIGAVIGPAIVPFAAHAITNLIIGVLFLVFAMVLFGLINLQPPAAMMNMASNASNQGGFLGVFAMGATLVITSFTCTAPFVGNLLALGADGGDFGRVILGMAVFGATMAIPFVVLSLVPGKLQALPRSGEWMNVLKVFLGFVEVAAALKFLSNVDLAWGWGFLSRELFLWLWAGTFVMAGTYLLGWIRMKGETGEIGPGRLVTAIGVFMLALYFGHGAAGNKLDWVTTSIIPPYSNRIESAVSHSAKAETGPVVVDNDYDAALARARDENKKVLLNFTGYL